MFLYNVVTFFEWYLRPLIKWFLKKTTGLCELQRICYGEVPGAARCLGVETSLHLSRTEEIKSVVEILDKAAEEKRFLIGNERRTVYHCVDIVIKAKCINTTNHPQFVVSFRECLEKIWSYKQLMVEIEEMRKIQYDCNNEEHEKKLLCLWANLVPNEVLLDRVSKQWQHIGFQGEDPKTDFRGMGLLGLENLLFFATQYTKAASHVLGHSHHPKYGYTFAIVGINITYLAYQLVKDGCAKTYMYNAIESLPSMAMFHRFYCYLFFEFDRIWILSKPKNMMEFSVIYRKFETVIRTKLANTSNKFVIQMDVDDV